ncbi:Uncharacterised protein [Mycobacteroides abscessus subsp. abscessus]|nr:Uncharacterised protein [Mycobacteroides abscessus subsp. abscessus]
MLGRHHVIANRPENQRISPEFAKRLGITDEARRVESRGGVGGQVARNVAVGEYGFRPPLDNSVGNRASCHPAEEQRRVAQPPNSE